MILSDKRINLTHLINTYNAAGVLIFITPNMNSPLEMFELNPKSWLGLEISDEATNVLICMLTTYLSTFIMGYEVLIESDKTDISNDVISKVVERVIMNNIHKLQDRELSIVTHFIFQAVLIQNVYNIMPMGDSSSSHLIYTLSMAATCFISLNLNGILFHGFSFIQLFFPPGVPAPLKPMLFIIEVISYAARLFSLGIRLFANMMAGHILLTILFTFLGTMFTDGTSVLFGPPLLFCVLSILSLELIISFLQAYVFGLLVTLYYADVISLQHG